MADPAPEPFGKLLADARRARGMKLQEVSAATKISVAKLQAIERDDVASLPGGIFTRGFVRSYAEAVGLDPRDTLAKFETRFPDQSSVATLHATIEGRANQEFVKRQRTVKGAGWIALVAAALAVWVLAGVMPDDEDQPPPPGAADREPPGQMGVTSDDRDQPPPGGTASGGAESANAPGFDPVPPPAPPRSSSPVPSQSPSPAPSESERRSDPPPAAAGDSAVLTMEIVPTLDCWVQAAADGDRVISRLLRAGERETIVAQGAIELRIGDAAACAFTINQRPGRALGGSGEVVDVRVTPSNYLRFVAE